jgi:hypothetical protein
MFSELYWLVVFGFFHVGTLLPVPPFVALADQQHQPRACQIRPSITTILVGVCLDEVYHRPNILRVAEGRQGCCPGGRSEELDDIV